MYGQSDGRQMFVFKWIQNELHPPHPPFFFGGGVKNNYMKMKLDFLFAWQNVWVGPPPPPPLLLRMILSAFRINNVEIK